MSADEPCIVPQVIADSSAMAARDWIFIRAMKGAISSPRRALYGLDAYQPKQGSSYRII